MNHEADQISLTVDPSLLEDSAQMRARRVEADLVGSRIRTEGAAIRQEERHARLRRCEAERVSEAAGLFIWPLRRLNGERETDALQMRGDGGEKIDDAAARRGIKRVIAVRQGDARGELFQSFAIGAFNSHCERSLMRRQYRQFYALEVRQ